ncbi:hypothetical protein Val02_13800 [Virgisporangium aliadipatigenens]|uniref:Uncharacterized protein n=1 Tax=Virgisporangium aliadipatigenens TaxID=741659 RepID=A0A8J3YG00_9ACTN|nr:hypothetical protein [Virgisporangium aliadipatigenens]GIJ44494.1 hypothetical protein Val02_13800 [Virgisporangium aliadipatigenens]
MICPHCHKDVKAKERTGHRCSKCRREFALDPKENDLKLHDLRLHRLTTQLSDSGRYAYTSQQLYWAAAGKHLKSAATGSAMLGGSFVALFTGTVFLFVAIGTESFVAFLPALLLYGGVILAVTLRLTGVWHKKVRISTTPQAFAANLNSWHRVYGGYPPGLVRQLPSVAPPARPVLAVLSPDSSVLTCLAANGVPQRLNVHLADRPAHVPQGVPVLLLHDASVAGYAFAAKMRAMWPGRRVMDASPRPAAVKAAKGAAKLRDVPPPQEHLAALRGQLSDADLDWLAKGWWSPVAAIKPASLLQRVQTAVDRLGAADPDTRRAASVGFLTWPAA